MPHELTQAIESGAVSAICGKNGETVYFIAPTCTQKDSIRRAIAKRNTWELGAFCAFGAAIVFALAAVAHYISI